MQTLKRRLIAEGKIVMIVDDNIIDQMITKHVLKINYLQDKFVVMDSATQALEYLEKNLGNEDAMPALIFLDVDMPDINGFGFLERFNNYSEQIKDACKIVVLTGNEIIEDINMMKSDPNVHQLIFKPLLKDSLLPVE
ncbi:MAG: response regulator [Pedobacter sp.]|nr:MAG: response regulator [Pedobacter sp.]